MPFDKPGDNGGMIFRRRTHGARPRSTDFRERTADASSWRHNRSPTASASVRTDIRFVLPLYPGNIPFVDGVPFRSGCEPPSSRFGIGRLPLFDAFLPPRLPFVLGRSPPKRRSFTPHARRRAADTLHPPAAPHARQPPPQAPRRGTPSLGGRRRPLRRRSAPGRRLLRARLFWRRA